MEALDGNAIAGLLVEVFGVEMTTASGVCSTCGTRSHVAEFEVYLDGPGVVARCRGCSNVLIVIVRTRRIACVDLRGLAVLEPVQGA
jgi:hypothetical protein